MVEIRLLTFGKCSYIFKFIDVEAGVMDLNESSSVLHCWFSHEGQSSRAEITAPGLRASQEAMSQRERLLMRSRMSAWLEVCVDNSGVLEEKYNSKWLEHGSPLRASAPDTYTTALLASLNPKQ